MVLACHAKPLGTLAQLCPGHNSAATGNTVQAITQPPSYPAADMVTACAPCCFTRYAQTNKLLIDSNAKAMTMTKLKAFARGVPISTKEPGAPVHTETGNDMRAAEIMCNKHERHESACATTLYVLLAVLNVLTAKKIHCWHSVR